MFMMVTMRIVYANSSYLILYRLYHGEFVVKNFGNMT